MSGLVQDLAKLQSNLSFSRLKVVAAMGAHFEEKLKSGDPSWQMAGEVLAETITQQTYLLRANLRVIQQARTKTTPDGWVKALMGDAPIHRFTKKARMETLVEKEEDGTPDEEQEQAVIEEMEEEGLCECEEEEPEEDEEEEVEEEETLPDEPSIAFATKEEYLLTVMSKISCSCPSSHVART